MSATYTKQDVQTHSEGMGYREGRPAVNVKVYDSMRDGFRAFQKYDPDSNPNLFTLDWIEAHVSDETLDAYFWQACEDGFESLQDEAREIWGKGVDVYSEGRSGGWAVVHGLNDIEDWNAVDLAKWRKFERTAKAYAGDIMYQVVSRAYLNDFESWATS